MQCLAYAEHSVGPLQVTAVGKEIERPEDLVEEVETSPPLLGAVQNDISVAQNYIER